MGYSTRFKLKVTKLSNDNKDQENLNKLKENILSINNVEEALKQINEFQRKLSLNDKDIIHILRSENTHARHALCVKGETNNNCSWYDAKEDIKCFSLRYPEWLFTLSGEGEESADIWSAYILNGKMQLEIAKWTLEPFDKNKLE